MIPSSSKIEKALAAGTILHGENYEYEVVKPLGQGTFGTTYLASVKMVGALGSIDTNTLVAVKEFFMKDFNGREDNSVTSSEDQGIYSYYKHKFINEAGNIAKLKHPGIIKVIELFEENNTAYFSMEYVGGGSLDDRIAASNGLDEPQALKYVLQIAKALEYMHSKHMLHLDLKPNNIMLRNDGNIVLIDFGLAKRFDDNGNPESSTTVGLGTPGYSPLEQAVYREEANNTFPATMDIYALGATMFKMITGRTPPEAPYILNEGFPVKDLFAKSCSPALIEVVRKCMAPLTKDRFQSVADCMQSVSVLSDADAASADPVYETTFFKVPSDVYEISVSFTPPFFHSFGRIHGGDFKFAFSLKDKPGGVVKLATFKHLKKEIDDLKIEIGPMTPDREDSEEPGELKLSFLSEKKENVNLSLRAFNIGGTGNIYNVSINDLAKSLYSIFSKYVPKEKGSSKSGDTIIEEANNDSDGSRQNNAVIQNIRSQIESFERQGAYKEAYGLCLHNIKNNQDIEYSNEKAQSLVALMQKNNKKKTCLAIFLVIVITILSTFLSIVFSN